MTNRAIPARVRIVSEVALSGLVEVEENRHPLAAAKLLADAIEDRLPLRRESPEDQHGTACQ
jgi:hypothetical protein